MISAPHHVATRRNIGTAQERRHDQDLYEEENGSCRECYDNNAIPGYPRCEACINGHGKEKKFRAKEGKSKCN